MASFAPIRDTRVNIQNTPIVDGQILFETDMGASNRIYIDVGANRVQIGGTGANYLYELGDIDFTNLIDKQILQYNENTNKWENTTALDEWYTDVSVDPAMASDGTKILLTNDTSVTFTVLKSLSSQVSFDAYAQVAEGADSLTLKNTVITTNTLDNTKDDITITLAKKVTSAQTGSGSECKIKLRIIR